MAKLVFIEAKLQSGLHLSNRAKPWCSSQVLLDRFSPWSLIRKFPIYFGNYLSTIRGVPRLSKNAKPPKYEFLVCDDSRDDVELLKRAFRVSGIVHRLRVFHAGLELLDYLEETQVSGNEPILPQILLLDLRMPRVDGFLILKTLKSDPRFKNLFFVALSEHDLQMIERAYREGANSYLIKPPNPVDISNLARFFDGWKRLTAGRALRFGN